MGSFKLWAQIGRLLAFGLGPGLVTLKISKLGVAIAPVVLKQGYVLYWIEEHGQVKAIWY